MKVEQIYELVNSITSEITGKTDLVKEDLSNVVDVGTEIFNNTSVDNYVKSLVDRIGKTIFVNRVYNGRVPNVLKDSWEYGSVLQKISADLPVASENETWELENGVSYDTNIFYKPSISAKFYNNKTTFEIAMSFTERQVKESFTNATELNAFTSMLYNSIEKSMTVKLDSLIMRTINNMIANTIDSDSDNIRAVNLLTMYNTDNGLTGQDVLTADKAMLNADFLRYASMKIALYTDRLGTMSTLFNSGNKERFTPKDKLHIIMLSDFEKASEVYLQSDTIHDTLVKLPNMDTVPFWQGSGQSYSFDDVSTINVTIKSGDTTKDIEQSGILCVMFDNDALGVSNLDRRTTTHYNAKAEFFNNWYKVDAGYFNDMNENFVVFFIADNE